ncbi:L,D-transpeptidase [Metabacillus sp. GX 13764]|uniref:L,D-transpeptidase n=1 Tax=Metabacillus kandeliae TaxID=2900151 RepID=UPI001E4555F9|nr:L,D-transpeptidase [Metabacillus kandeliae]MCD7034749.1 L,D-transpeptidase [Metabacillus kandeliae]
MKKIWGLLIAVLLFSAAAVPPPVQAADSQLIIINKSTNTLAFFDNGKLQKVFKVATGKNDSLTPEGTFSIVNKIKNRPYYKSHIPGGSKLNPLGDRWLGLNARGTYGTTYAIHGNNNSGSIGKYISGGCVRMYNQDVHWLFDHVRTYTKVKILHSSKSFPVIAASAGYKVASAPAAADKRTGSFFWKK